MPKYHIRDAHNRLEAKFDTEQEARDYVANFPRRIMSIDKVTRYGPRPRVGARASLRITVYRQGC
jgi:hypothetical protein